MSSLSPPGRCSRNWSSTSSRPTRRPAFATIVAGDNPPAGAAGQGNLTKSMAQNETWVLGPLSSARFLQSDGTLQIDLAASFAGEVTAYYIPERLMAAVLLVVRVRGEGGAEYDLDYPVPDPHRHETVEGQFDGGTLTVVGIVAGGVIEPCTLDDLRAATGTAADHGVPGDTMPTRSAPKADWWITPSPGATDGDLHGLTKDALVELYGPLDDLEDEV